MPVLFSEGETVVSAAQDLSRLSLQPMHSLSKGEVLNQFCSTLRKSCFICVNWSWKRVITQSCAYRRCLLFYDVESRVYFEPHRKCNGLRCVTDLHLFCFTNHSPSTKWNKNQLACFDDKLSTSCNYRPFPSTICWSASRDCVVFFSSQKGDQQAVSDSDASWSALRRTTNYISYIITALPEPSCDLGGVEGRIVSGVLFSLDSSIELPAVVVTAGSLTDRKIH